MASGGCALEEGLGTVRSGVPGEAAMGIDSHLLDLLERWESLYNQGKLVPPEELCRDCPDLLEEVKQRIDHLLALKAKLNTAAEAGASSAVPWSDAEGASRS